MRSIRFWLLLYFLLLLAGALSAFSVLIYSTTHDRLAGVVTSTRKELEQQKQRTNRLLKDHLASTEQILRSNFDQSLLEQAERLAGHLARHIPYVERGTALGLSGLLTAGHLAPLGYSHFLAPVLIDQQWNGGRVWIVLHLRQLQVQFIDGQRPESDNEPGVAFFQITNEQGEVLHASKSMCKGRWPMEPEVARMRLLSARFDSLRSPRGCEVRRVTLKVPVIGRAFLRRSWPRRSSRSRRSSSGRHYHRHAIVVFPLDPERIEPRDAPVVFIQYARPLREVEGVLGSLREDMERTRQQFEASSRETLRKLRDDSKAALVALRNKLLLISGVTFLATTLGGVWLVGRGLGPLQRIAAAVSRVSEKNFRLDLSHQEVPAELAPVVAKLQQSLASLERAFAREKQAAADISHDLRTPISALLATIQVCLRKPRTSDQYQAALRSCRDIGRQLDLLVERFLKLARLDAGGDTYKPEPVDVADLADQCASMVRPLAETRGVEVRYHGDSPVVLDTDPTKLREVLTNLLDNAIDYNRPGGRVDLRVGRDNGEVRIEVADTGIGIGSQAREHLFERFYRADPSRHSDKPHAGLGLAIVKGYLDLMGGRIDVTSEEGKGSTFRITLPASENGRGRPARSVESTARPTAVHS